VAPYLATPEWQPSFIRKDQAEFLPRTAGRPPGCILVCTVPLESIDGKIR
jgi:hypothetical protein